MIEIRPLTEHAEIVEAVQLQKTIWGFEDIDLLPVRLFVVATKVGGQVFGAFDQGAHRPRGVEHEGDFNGGFGGCGRRGGEGQGGKGS